MATVKVIETGEIHELCLVISEDGIDCLADVIGDFTDGSTIMMSDDANFEMTEEAFEWWDAWCDREARIQEALADASEEQLDKYQLILTGYGDDFEACQCLVCEMLGIDYDLD